MSVRFAATPDSLAYIGGPATVTPMTFAAWLYRSSNRGSVTLPMSIIDSGGAIIHGLAMDGADNDIGIYSNSGLAVGSPLFDVQDRGWYHVAYRRTGNRHSLVVDGAVVHSLEDAVSAAAAYVAIGGSNSALWLDGKMAQVRLWVDHLNPEDLVAESRSIVAVRKANLFGDWPLNEQNPLADVSGNGRTLTTFGAPSVDSDPIIASRSASASRKILRRLVRAVH